MNIKSYIKDLLFTHDCVIIPGFGGFVTNYQSSEINNYKNILYPPSKSVLFNRQLQTNDGLLINYIAKQEQCSYKSAEEQLNYEVFGWINKLDRREIISFQDVGKVYYNTAGNLIFLPELRTNFLIDTFGLKPVSFDPHYRQQSETDPEETPIIEIDEPLSREVTKQTRARRRPALIGLAASVLLIILFSQFIIWNVSPENLRLQNLTIFTIPHDEMEFAKTIELLSGKAPLLLHSKQTATHLRSFNAGKLQESPLTAPGTGYYIIFGSFRDLSNAESLKNKLTTIHHKPGKVFSLPNGYYRVGLFVAKDMTEAQQELHYFKSTLNSSLWMVHSKG